MVPDSDNLSRTGIGRIHPLDCRFPYKVKCGPFHQTRATFCRPILAAMATFIVCTWPGISLIPHYQVHHVGLSQVLQVCRRFFALRRVGWTDPYSGNPNSRLSSYTLDRNPIPRRTRAQYLSMHPRALCSITLLYGSLDHLCGLNCIE